MYRRLVMVSVAMVLAVVCSATAQQPEAPKIVSWSNSKTADQKTVFAVKPGEKITFTVKAKDAEKYQWLADGKVAEGAKDASFQWTVPNKKGMWKILVKTTNKAREKWAKEKLEQEAIKRWIKGLDGAETLRRKDRFLQEMVDLNAYPEKGRTEWIVSTFLTTVKPGESIQKAIDSLPAEGGIVELAPGTHEVNDELYPPGAYKYAYKNYQVKYSILIKRNNVTIYGPRQAIVRHHNNAVSCFFIPDLDAKAIDPSLCVENITFRGFTTATAYTKGADKHAGVIRVHHVKNLTVEDMHDTSTARGVRYFVCSGAAPNKHLKMIARRSINVYCRNNIVEHRGIYGSNCENVYQINNTMKSTSCGWSAMGMEERTWNVHVIGNRINIVGVTSFGISVLAGGGHLWNVRDNVVKGGNWGIWVGSGIRHRLIINNTVTGTSGKGAGIYTRPNVHSNILIMNNRVYNNRGNGIWAAQFITKTPGKSDEIFMNNTIYNNGGDGIRIDGDQWKILNITNNIIVGNKGYGINRSKSTVALSHNNVWRNAKGNYNGVSAGEGDISVDPLFADSANGRFRLKSKAGRWDPKAKKWVKDNVHSPCIDAGDPKADFSKEPAPSGGRINIGAYGNTKEASKSVVRQTGCYR